MENTLTVRVLDRFTDLDEEFHALPDAQFALVAKLRNRAPDHQLHSEVRQTGRRFAGVEYPSDIRVIHHGQCLSLHEKSRDELLRGHLRMNDLQCDVASDRRGLTSPENHAHSAFSEPLPDFVHARCSDLAEVKRAPIQRTPRRSLEHRSGVALLSQQALDFASHTFVAASRVEVRRTLLPWQRQRFQTEPLQLRNPVRIRFELHCFISRESQSLAKFQSRFTVSTETFRTSAISSFASPPKKRISTTWTLRGS